jgi:hypothetical protein
MSKIAVVYETKFKEVLASSSLSNSEKVEQLINFKPAPVWNSEKKKYEYAGDCGPLREIVKIYKPKYLEKVRDIADRKKGIIENEKDKMKAKIEFEKMTSLVCPDSKNGFIILGNDDYEYEEQVCGYTKNFAEAHTIALEAVTTGQKRIKSYESDERGAFSSSRIVDLDTRLQIGTKMIGYFFGQDIVLNLNWVIEEIKKMEEEMLILEEEFLKLVFVEFAKKEYSVQDNENQNINDSW